MSATQTTWLITGGSRGIGLGIVTQLITNQNNIIIATCRNPDDATQLRELRSTAKAALHVVPLELADMSSILAVEGKVKEILGDKGLDYLIQNAAVIIADDFAFEFKFEDLMDTFRINVAGPAVLTSTLLPHVERGRRKVIANLTSRFSSFGRDVGPECMTYSVSKSALNMLVYKQARERPDLVIFAIDPGWVKTDMGGENALLELHESVPGIVKFIEGARPEHTSGTFRYDGTDLPR